jgi:dephospho-CoA kinase
MIIGITGTFGSGKTTVSDMFRSYGFHVINLDRFYRTLIQPSTPLYRRIIKEFGNAIIKKNKNIDRKKLKKIVFNDSTKLKRLNSITHPYIIKKLKNALNESINKKIIIDAPLLIEAKAAGLVEKIIVVKSKKPKIMERLIKKGKYTKLEIEKITNSQMPIKKKIKYADFVIDNSGSLSKTKKQVQKIIGGLL